MCHTSKLHTIKRCIINFDHRRLNYVKSNRSPHVRLLLRLRLPIQCSVHVWIIVLCRTYTNKRICTPMATAAVAVACVQRTIRQFNLNSIDFKWNENLTWTVQERRRDTQMNWWFRCTHSFVGEKKSPKSYNFPASLLIECVELHIQSNVHQYSQTR